jgi:starvation-inducible DNA-binding protein
MQYFKLVEQAEAMINEAAEPALVDALNKVFADAFVFYFKSHSFHWNVVGKDFPQLHEFFGKVYEGVFDNIDRLAEEIRAVGAMAPMNLASLIASASLMENKDPLTGIEMVQKLRDDNLKILAGLLACQKMAEAADEVGLANFLQDLFDGHKKFGWMFDSILKG